MKIRALTISHILPSFNASVSNIVYTTSAQTITYSESTPDISYDIFIVPMTNLPGLSVTVIDSIPLFTIGSNPSDSITVSENVLKSIAAVFSNSVTASDTSFRAFSSSVDFDPSDSDLDPDPVTVSDSQTFSLAKIFSNSISLSDSLVLNSGKVTTDSVTSSDVAPLFTVGQTSSDSVSVSESVAKSAGQTSSDSVSTSDAAPVFTIGQISSDSVSTSESVSTELLLGETNPLFSYAFVSDGPFVRTLFNAQSHYNNNNYAYEAQTGMLNGPGMIGNSPMFNDLFITYTQNDGFSIDFIYTSVDDRAINGYMLNETVMVGTSLNV